MANNSLPTAVTTPRFRNSFPHIFEPQLNKLNGKLEYSVQALFEEGADLSGLQLAAKNAAINKWGADQAKWPKNMKSPFKKQKELIESAQKKDKAHDHLSATAAFMTFKTSAVDKNGKRKPHPIVVGKDPKKVIEEESLFYAGCWAKANVNASAYEKGGNCGITFYLNACQFVGDADPFSGKPNVESAFEAIPEDVVSGVGQGDEGSDATSMFS